MAAAEFDPKNTKRGDRFENVAYFGLSANLAGELRTIAWNQNLISLGLKWHIVEAKEYWNDYSKVDVVLAVRGFNRKRYLDKPASKLYNLNVAREWSNLLKNSM